MSTLIIQCDAAQYWYGLAISAVHWMPWLITGAFYVGYAVTGDGVFQFISYFLSWTTLSMYAQQAYFDDSYVDPFCGDFKTWAFPNMTVAVTWALVVFLVFFRRWYSIR